MTFASKVRKTAIATVAVLTVVTAGATVAPTEAHAGNNLFGALIGGAIIGGIITTSHNRYNAPTYRTCHTQWETRYNSYGHAYDVQVQYC